MTADLPNPEAPEAPELPGAPEAPTTSGTSGAAEPGATPLRSAAWFGHGPVGGHLRAFSHRSRLSQLGYEAQEYEGDRKSVV